MSDWTAPDIKLHPYIDVTGQARVAYGRYDEPSDTYYVTLFASQGESRWVHVPEEVYETEGELRAASEFMWLKIDSTGRMTGFKIEHFQRANHKYHFTKSLERIFAL